MLASPNQGSELADFFAAGTLLAAVVGPSAAALGTGTASVPIGLGPVSGFDVGVITGNRSWNPLLSWIIPGPDDGRVAVERAKLDGMRDFLVVSRTHTFLMNADEVIEQTARFLETGAFLHSSRDRENTPDRAAPVGAATGG
jgi:hypothetical protein